MNSTQPRKTTRVSRATAKSKAAAVASDDLVEHLAMLTVSDSNDAKKPLASAAEKRRLAAMRSVNSALKKLSDVVQSGWKVKPRATTNSAQTLRDVNALVTSVSKSLQELRELRPRDVDVERAAISVVGRLIALDMVCTSTIVQTSLY
jgi:separase